MANDRLSPVRLAVVKATNAGANLALEEIQKLPLATEEAKNYGMPLFCELTGLWVGNITLLNVAGKMPMVKNWHQNQFHHPIFSISHGGLLKLARNTWLRFCALSDLEAADERTVNKQEELLCVITSAMLHKLTDVKQDGPWLPQWHEIADNWTSMIAISYWHLYLESDRFKFPSLRIRKGEGISIKGFLQACWERKKEYESIVNQRTLDEEEKKRAELAERLMVKIRDEAAGKKPVSQKIIWRWFVANMPKRYEKDINSWMQEIYFSDLDDLLANERTEADIQLFEDMFVSECPIGTLISRNFLENLRGKAALLAGHYKVFEILAPKALELNPLSGTPEPLLSNFSSKILWMKARAQWYLAQPSSQKHQAAAVLHRNERTVHPSFIPRLRTSTETDIPEFEDSVISGFGELYEQRGEKYE